MSLPEIAEAEATGRIAEIYAAILAATGLPSTNLVWRHMASHPGVLEWAYGALEPAFVSGAFQDLAAKVTADMPAAPMPDFTAEDGLDREVLRAADAVLAFYNRANPINLAALVTLRVVLSGEAPAGAAVIETAGREALRPVLPALPALPPLAVDVDPDTRRRMADLARLVNGRETALMPTALRHLANWPALIAAMHGRVVALVAAGTVDGDAALLRGRVDAGAAAIPVFVDEASRPDADTLEALNAVIDLFLPPISRMVVVGRAMSGALRRSAAS